MNLKELKSMIAEEYKSYMAEQAAPGVAVADTDVDATGGDDSEATLRQIYDMLKDYFEGGEAGAGGDIAADDEVGDDAGDATDDVADYDGGEGEDDDSDGGEALQERFKKLANIING